ncbi:hypothetical protein [Paraburkholderia domus]|uniref:hypothetical protein n=1 Tax=Paraburkholderia domus TaxID=2793075 RepID=UPI0019137E0A|nr:hypothetical protein [Paraburkholderia domus]MBK5066350.1 hypothetical protein [Burkholderia sp. R-70199]CAE6969554.1 hypothetical protein R70199_08084 [Paraburkholderia domus]
MNNYNLKHIVIPHSAISDFTDREIYAINMLGHMYNETITLSKLTFISKGTLNQPQAVRDANMFQTIFFARLHAGKLHEAQQTINKNPDIMSFLINRCFSLIGEDRGKALLKQFNSKISDCKWLSDARNKDAMHFGTFEQLQKGVQEIRENDIGFEMIRGNLAIGTLFLTSNVMTALSFYHRAEATDWLTGLKKLIQDIEQAQDSLMALISESLRSLINSKRDENLPEESRLREHNIESFDVASIHDFHLPYFFGEK